MSSFASTLTNPLGEEREPQTTPPSVVLVAASKADAAGTAHYARGGREETASPSGRIKSEPHYRPSRGDGERGLETVASGRGFREKKEGEK
jgi:hypothetical protein